MNLTEKYERELATPKQIFALKLLIIQLSQVLVIVGKLQL